MATTTDFDPTLIPLYIQAVALVATAFGAAYFAWRQNQINKKQYEVNKRMQELADYVAINIIGAVFKDEATSQPKPIVQVKNVGKLNLYLHKFEIGSLTETYERARLIDCGGEISFTIPIPYRTGQFGVQHMSIKLYLTDESENRYLYTGAIEINVQPIPATLPVLQENPQQQSQGPQQQFILQAGMDIRAWSYKTEKYWWEI